MTAVSKQMSRPEHHDTSPWTDWKKTQTSNCWRFQVGILTKAFCDKQGLGSAAKPLSFRSCPVGRSGNLVATS